MVRWREILVELTYHTISRLHIFYHLFSTYDNFINLYSPHLLESGGHRRAWLTKSVVPNTLIQFDSNTFPADTRTTFHTGATFLASVLYHSPPQRLSHSGGEWFYTITCECLCSDLSMVSLYIYIFLASWLII